MSSAEKPITVYCVERKNQHGYWMDSIRLMRGARVETIEDRIAKCTAHNYQTQEVADRLRAEYVALKADGVATIVDPILYGSTWLRIEFQEYKSGPPVEHCEANIQLTDTPAQIPGAARMLAQLQARMDRRNRHHRWHSFAIALLAADRLCDMRVEQYRYRTRDGYERFEYVVRKPVAAQAVAV